jgi:hypothetical protein
MFQNVILPDVPVDQMRGVFALLSLIGNPQSQAATEFLQKLSAEKDAAVAALNQSQLNNADTARLAATVSDLQAREAALAERETALADARAALERDRAAFQATMKSIADLAPLFKK